MIEYSTFGLCYVEGAEIFPPSGSDLQSHAKPRANSSVRMVEKEM
jgi:hypothetical protein